MSALVNLIELREGGVHDVPGVDAIMKDAFDPRFGEAWTSAQVMGMLSLPGVWLTLASLDGADAGFAMARAIAGEAELLLLATRPAARRRGVARALLRSVIEEVGFRSVTQLHLEVRAGNDAVQLYRREGFEKVGERRGYYRGRAGQSFDAQTFARNIG
jgi:[ribosomal protein S18]-alanine N-acetyltransferase